MKSADRTLIEPGDQIGIIAPSGAFKKVRLVSAIKYFEKAGYKVKLGNYIYHFDRYLAGSAQNRVQDLHMMFRSKSIKAIFSARGGYGATQMLPLINYDLIKNNHKPLFGFSDTTALQIALFEKAKLPTISGLSLCSDFTPKGSNDMTRNSLENFIQTSNFDTFQLKANKKHLEIKGKITGGCLTLVSALCGTAFQATLKNRILVLEDVKEEPYHVDRMLTQLSQQKDFHLLKGIIFGNFHECNAENPKHGSLETVLHKFAKSISIPVFYNLPYGHQNARCQIPIGLEATINKSSRLSFSRFKINK